MGIALNTSQLQRLVEHDRNPTLSELLLHIYQDLFSQRHSFLALARNAPMHGLLTSLRVTIDLDDNVHQFHHHLLSTLEESVSYMLSVLSGGKRFGRLSIYYSNL